MEILPAEKITWKYLKEWLTIFNRQYYEAARGVASQLNVETLDFREALDHPDMFRDSSLVVTIVRQK